MLTGVHAKQKVYLYHYIFPYSKPLKNCVLLTTGYKQDLC